MSRTLADMTPEGQKKAVEVIENAWCERSHTERPNDLSPSTLAAWKMLHQVIHRDIWNEDAKFVAQALADAGLLMPDLPEPSRDMVSPAGKVWYSNGPLSDIRATRDGIVAFGSWKETPFRVQLTATQAEELAGILWAAARHHAEQEQDNV